MRMGMGELLVVLIIALVIFGPKQLPKLGKTLGEAFGKFKHYTDVSTAWDFDDDDEDEKPKKKSAAKKGKKTEPSSGSGGDKTIEKEAAAERPGVAEYRRIRYDRTYRPLGKMSWWRIVLGVALLLLVVFLSGTASQSFAARGKFIMARKVMLSPGWMERYKPDTLAFINAGVLYEEGDYEGAYSGFSAIDGLDAADTMKSRTALKLAAIRTEEGHFEDAYWLLVSIDPERLGDDEKPELRRLCRELTEFYAASTDEETAQKLQTLVDILRAAG